jgi:hypothetical protein
VLPVHGSRLAGRAPGPRNSDMLAATTLDAMLARRGKLDVAVVPDQGHAPLLAEARLIRQIAAFAASCDAS